MGFNTIFDHRFATSQEAVESCQCYAHQEGFSVRIRTSKANTVYIVCSKEGKPEHKAIEPKKRNRNSERCHCGWRVVLFYNVASLNSNKWEFRTGKTMLHNHPLIMQIERHSFPYYTFPKPMYAQFSPLSIKSTPLDITLPSIHSILGNIPDYYPTCRNISPSLTTLTPSIADYDEPDSSHAKDLFHSYLN